MSGLSSYLMSTLSRVGGLGGSSGIPDFPFVVGEKVATVWPWTIHAGTSTDGKHVSIFVFDKPRGTQYVGAAQNALRRMRTLRHPGVLRYMGGAETSDAIYIATERIVPLDLNDRNEELVRWGLFRIAEALRFVNEDCKLVHANVCKDAVFVTDAGEWRLGGLELMDAVGAERPVYREMGSVIPGYAGRMAPEIKVQGMQGTAALDGWGLAELISECYTTEMPLGLGALHAQLRNNNPKLRMTAPGFVEAAQRSGGVLDTAFVRACRFLESVTVKDSHERAEFFAGLGAAAAEFPRVFAQRKMLPELLTLVEFGGADNGHSAVLASVVQIARDMDETEYSTVVAPAVVRLFASTDRALRFALLEHATALLHGMHDDVVVASVYPAFATGFGDAAPAIREATVKAALSMAPRVGSKTLNSDLIKHLVRAVADAEPGIRTNSLICIGKLCAKNGPGVTDTSLRYIVCPALLHALRDVFPPVRAAALAVSGACAMRWDAVDVARRVVPAISPLLVDGERPVRVAAVKAINVMVAHIEGHAREMPETVAKKMDKVGAQAEAVADLAANGWGGWAVSSLSSTISGAISLASSVSQSGARSESAGVRSEPAGVRSEPSGIRTEPSGLSEPPQVSQRPSTTINSPTAVSTSIPSNAAVSQSAGGWEFNDDWGEDAADAWGIDDNDDDSWNAQSNTTGGMTAVANTPVKLAKPAAITPVIKPVVKPVTKKDTKPVQPRRKGLGAMKLGGGAKSNPVDQFL
ncbi:Nuclear aminoacylation-dependent tRNA export pathway component [Coemansia sp. RSA 1935]|nr:Nuclear aminoacylation-dependent tRNA export pathway component [Coemansia sp. RSA 1935]